MIFARRHAALKTVPILYRFIVIQEHSVCVQTAFLPALRENGIDIRRHGDNLLAILRAPERELLSTHIDVGPLTSQVRYSEIETGKRNT